MYVSHAISYERNIANVPPSLSCFSLGVLALETCNQECLPSFPLFLCDMMASCRFEIWRWREGKKTTHLWCWVAQLQRNLLAAIDLDVISREIVVCVGGWSCWLIHSSATTVTWTLVISSQGIHIPFYRRARANSKARMGIEMYVLVWNHQAVCACVCVRAAPIEGASVLLMNLRALWQDKVLAILCVEPTRGAGGQESSCASPTTHMLVRVCVLVISCVASMAEEAAGRR